MELFKNLTQVLGIALVHRHIQVDLRERVKELTCLYEIARLGAQPSLSLEEILQGIVELLPPAWLYPEITSARIILDGRSYSTPYFQEGSHQLRANIFIQGEKQGVVEVTYRGKKTELDEGPFLKEERSLIDAVAKEVAIILKRRKDEEDKFRLEEQPARGPVGHHRTACCRVAHEPTNPGQHPWFAQLANARVSPPAGWTSKDLERLSLCERNREEPQIFARQMPPKKIPVNLNEIIDEGLYFFESRCAREGIELVRAFSSELPEIYADPAQINQVLVNLVVNALQAMPEGGKLFIKTFNQGDYVSLIVEDTGTGMSKEILNKIFTPFFTTKDVGQGTGLGLPVVHGIVISHGGSIHVESKLGQGTRFEIQLPGRGLQEAKENSEDGLSS
jgi:nitrogen-specific signal transduction histidine kinase